MAISFDSGKTVEIYVGDVDLSEGDLYYDKPEDLVEFLKRALGPVYAGLWETKVEEKLIIKAMKARQKERKKLEAERATWGR